MIEHSSLAAYRIEHAAEIANEIKSMPEWPGDYIPFYRLPIPARKALMHDAPEGFDPLRDSAMRTAAMTGLRPDGLGERDQERVQHPRSGKGVSVQRYDDPADDAIAFDPEARLRALHGGGA